MVRSNQGLVSWFFLVFKEVTDYVKMIADYFIINRSQLHNSWFWRWNGEIEAVEIYREMQEYNIQNVDYAIKWVDYADANVSLCCKRRLILCARLNVTGPSKVFIR